MTVYAYDKRRHINGKTWKGVEEGSKRDKVAAVVDMMRMAGLPVRMVKLEASAHCIATWLILIADDVSDEQYALLNNFDSLMRDMD